MKIQIEIDTAFVASEVNSILDSEDETAESVQRWVEQNDSLLPGLMHTALAAYLTDEA